MRFKQTLIPHILVLLALMLSWDRHCFAQAERAVADSLYLYDEEEAEIQADPVYRGPSNNDIYLKEKLEERDFKSESWSKAVQGLDYSQDTPEPPKPQEERDRSSDWDTGAGAAEGLGIVGQVLLFGAVVAVLAMILFFLVGGRYTKNKKIRNEEMFTIEDIEERIHESDLDRFLREALSKNDFRLAVRIYYLAIIKELSVKQLIRWKKDKTNREYLNEVVSRKPEIYNDFRDTTLAFEKVWYGDMNITEGDYMNISPRFKNFIEGLGRLN